MTRDEEEELDTFVLIVVLLVLPWIVHVLHAPLLAVACVAVGAWPLAAVATVMLVNQVKTRREQSK